MRLVSDPPEYELLHEENVCDYNDSTHEVLCVEYLNFAYSYELLYDVD